MVLVLVGVTVVYGLYAAQHQAAVQRIHDQNFRYVERWLYQLLSNASKVLWWVQLSSRCDHYLQAVNYIPFTDRYMVVYWLCNGRLSGRSQHARYSKYYRYTLPIPMMILLILALPNSGSPTACLCTHV